VSDLSLSLSRPSSLLSCFLSPVQLRRGSDRPVLVGTWHLSRPNQNNDQEKEGDNVNKDKMRQLKDQARRD